MIPVPRPSCENEPEFFDDNCRQPGKTFLEAYPKKDPHEKSDWWSQFKPALAELFSLRCGWLATTITLEGQVDHFLSCGNRKDKTSPHRDLAFEWTNFRYASGPVNSRKGTHDDNILDPCEIEDGWFEITLDGFQLLFTNQLPETLQEKAKDTLDLLELRNGAHARASRWNWYKRYWNNGDPDLEGLERDAPLVAKAVRKALEVGQELPNPEEFEAACKIRKRLRKYSARKPKEENASQRTP